MGNVLGYGITFPAVYSGGVKAAGATFPVIGFILLAMRLYAHRLTKSKPGMADLFGVIAWLFILAMGTVFIWSADHGALGHPSPPGNPVKETTITENAKIINISQFLVQMLMTLALGTTKLSVLFFFRRLFVVNRRNMWDWITRVLIALVSAWTIAFFFGFLFNCGTHVSALWGPLDVYEKYCVATAAANAALQNAFGISDIILDFACLIIPFPVIWNLQLALRFKISITGIFAVGFLTMAVSIARTILWIQCVNAPYTPALNDNIIVTVSLQWGMIECGLAFIASQLPALGIFFTKATMDRFVTGFSAFVSLVSLRSTGHRSQNRGNVDDLETGKSGGITVSRDINVEEARATRDGMRSSGSTAAHEWDEVKFAKVETSHTYH